jgi:hypothetical protein
MINFIKKEPKMNKVLSTISMTAVLFFTLASFGAKKDVFFVYPKDGDTVALSFKAKFGVHGMAIKPAGDPDDKKSGHMHVIIDGKAAPEGEVIPADPTHLHYGKGQTEGDITLTPGPHTLTLQLADGLHRGYGSDLVKEIHVTAK